MKIRAAVMTSAKAPLEVADLELDPPGRDEVLVRVEASGICRSDLSYIDGKWPAPLPIVLGHEGAGVVEAVGEGVDPGRAGESVVLTFARVRAVPAVPRGAREPLPRRRPGPRFRLYARRHDAALPGSIRRGCLRYRSAHSKSPSLAVLAP